MTLVYLTFAMQACTPTVAVRSDEPITINLNVKIDHEIVLRVDEELDALFESDDDIF
jgi:hypothetical protein